MALDLARAGIEVLLLEAGGIGHDEAGQDFYRGAVADAAMHSPLDEYRERRLGGSTTIWGGRCMPFDPIDFEARDWVPHSGGPSGARKPAPNEPRSGIAQAALAHDRSPGGSR